MIMRHIRLKIRKTPLTMPPAWLRDVFCDFHHESHA